MQRLIFSISEGSVGVLAPLSLLLLHFSCPDALACCLSPPLQSLPTSPVWTWMRFSAFPWLNFTFVEPIIDYILTFGVGTSAPGGFQVIFVVIWLAGVCCASCHGYVTEKRDCLSVRKHEFQNLSTLLFFCLFLSSGLCHIHANDTWWATQQSSLSAVAE